MSKLIAYWQNINPISSILYPLSLIFCCLIWIRRILYRHAWLKSYKSPLPVVVVGNIYVGGNGKTPLVVYLIEALRKKGFRPGVVSRGYGSKNSNMDKQSAISVNIAQQAALFGDEPWMIAARTQAPVVIGRKRSNAIKYLLAEHACDIIISDDGLQHYAMQRDYEICVIDGNRLFGNRFCLPAGPLREKVSRLDEVNLLVYNGITRNPLDTHSEKSCYMQMIFQDMIALSNPLVTQSIKDLAGCTVHAIAGIGRPTRFFEQLKSYGINLIEHAFDDHHAYQKKDLKFSDDLPIIMTEKDAVKCRNLDLENTWYIPITIELTEDITERIIASLGLTTSQSLMRREEI